VGDQIEDRSGWILTGQSYAPKDRRAASGEDRFGGDFIPIDDGVGVGKLWTAHDHKCQQEGYEKGASSDIFHFSVPI
jgi:hypothetical protein